MRACKVIDHWLATKEGSVKASTLKGYKVSVNGAIRGPLLIGTKQERADYTGSGVAPKGARFIKLLGHVKLTDLDTAMIRQWHCTVTDQCGAYTANRAKSHLKSILALAEEDFGVRGAVDADRPAARSSQGQEGDPDARAYRQTDRGGVGGCKTRYLLRLPVPRRNPPLRTARPALERSGLRPERDPATGTACSRPASFDNRGHFGRFRLCDFNRPENTKAAEFCGS